MRLTSHQRSVLRSAIPDQDTLSEVMSVLENATQPTKPPLPTQKLNANFIADNIDLITKAIDFLPIAFFIKDRQSRFVFANMQTVYDIGQTNHHDLLGKTDFDLLEHQYAQRYYQREQMLMASQTAVLNEEVETSSIRGDLMWILSSKQPIRNSNGEVIGLVGVNIDITRQKEAEQDLVAERNLLRTLINTIDDQIFIKDLDGRFIIANDPVLKLTKVKTYEQLIGTTDFDHFPASSAQEYFDDEQAIMQSGIPITNKEYTWYEDGSEDPEWWQMSKVPLYSEDGNIVGIVGVNREITEQKHAQQRELDYEVEHTRRQILSDFISGSSHEFRTPISAINSALYLLGKTDDPEKKARYIEKINRQTETLTRLIDMMNQMMEFDRGIQLFIQTFDAQPFIDNMLSEVQSRSEAKHLTLEADVSPTVNTMYGDPILLKRAIQTIIDNAITYTPEHGTITLTIIDDDTHHHISINDTGIGMTEETQNHIFERFYRADKSRTQSGFGLGLPIARRIVEMHNGTIAVSSEIGAGSEFIVTLPKSTIIRANVS